MAWRFGGGIFTKSFSRTQLLLFNHPATYRNVPALRPPSWPAPRAHRLRLQQMGLHSSSSRYFRVHQASRADLHDGEVFPLLAGRTPHRSSAASYLLHLYHTLAWRTCCLLILRTSHDVFDFTPLPLQDSGNDLWNLYVLPFTFLYQNHLEIYIPKKSASLL